MQLSASQNAAANRFGELYGEMKTLKAEILAATEPQRSRLAALEAELPGVLQAIQGVPA